MRWSDLQEALKPSEYRPLVKGWNKERYADIFKSDKYKHDKNGYRVILPLKSLEREISNTQNAVEAILSHNGYEVVDYIKGLAKNKETGQQIKIGKVLTKLDLEYVLRSFTSDETREAVKSEYIVVISRHPYDIAGMSTNRGWTSCMNLQDGSHKKFVPLEIEAGTVIAYVTSKSDPDLKNPTGRIAIKPFVNALDPDNKDFIYFGIERRVYGTDVPGFRQTVLEWVDWVNSSNKLEGVAYITMNTKSYPDGMDRDSKVLGKEEQKEHLEFLKANPNEIYRMDEVSEDEMIAVLDGDKSKFEYIVEKFGLPSERVQRFAVSLFLDNIDFIPNPSESVIVTAIQKVASYFKKVDNPTDKMKMAFIQKDPLGFDIVKNPTEDMQIVAVRAEPGNLLHIENPSEAVQMTAINQNGNYLHYVNNPTKRVQMAAVKKNPRSIKYIKTPNIDPEIQMIAVTEDPYVIDFIKNPSKEALEYARSQGLKV